jgi:UDP-2-acetamido-3-amino-2,3-dideoxy-glucuronate N-acetyltransferase
MQLHKTAEIDPSVKIGEGTKVWHYVQICKGVVIGKNCVIGKNVYIGPNVVIGDDCKIQNNSLIYEGVSLGNRVFIGPNVVTTNDIRPKAVGPWEDRFKETIIRDDVSVGANSTILCGITLNARCEIGCGSLVTKDCVTGGLYYNPNTVALLKEVNDG